MCKGWFFECVHRGRVMGSFEPGVEPAHVEQLLWLERESLVRALGGPK